MFTLNRVGNYLGTPLFPYPCDHHSRLWRRVPAGDYFIGTGNGIAGR